MLVQWIQFIVLRDKTQSKGLFEMQKQEFKTTHLAALCEVVYLSWYFSKQHQSRDTRKQTSNNLVIHSIS